jgi:branched-chain amino acid transport system substrate-binding protein
MHAPKASAASPWETHLPYISYTLESTYHTAYQNKYHQNPDFGPGVGYDAVLVLAQALKDAKSSDPGALRTAIEGMHGFQGVVGTYDFSASDHRGLSVDSVGIVQVSGGGFEAVEPGQGQ